MPGAGAREPSGRVQPSEGQSGLAVAVKTAGDG